MLQDLDRQRMALRREVVEHLGVGCPRAVLVALAAGQLLLVEQDLAELLGRADVELAAGDLVDLDLQLAQPLLEVGRQHPERRRIDLDAGLLHRQQHRDQRPLDRLVQRHHVFGGDARLELRPELQGHVGVLGGILHGALDRHLVEAHLLGARARHVGELDGLLAEVALGQFVHAVAVLAGVEHEGQQHRVVDRPDRDAVPLEHAHVVLDVLADLEHARVLEQRLQPVDHGLERELVWQQLAACCLVAVAVEIERALCSLGRLATRLAVCQRQVGRAAAAGIDVAPRSVEQGERQADQPRIVRDRARRSRSRRRRRRPWSPRRSTRPAPPRCGSFRSRPR